MKALSDETRVEIFDMLVNGELCACDILEKFSITQPTLSYHMKILCESGLVDSRRDGVWMKYAIHNYIPQEIITAILGQEKWYSVLLASFVGIPMYADIFGTLPIAEALVLKGVDNDDH
ncbi:MAG TPA: metalloregulator ArsR/SmtB family transcription factor [Epulopiscium sp.]|nr:metalloregulator ArsR/SmtB family transcription factor [Candidatus Epulonipiscium sp.]